MSTDEHAWQQWLSWLERAPTFESPAEATAEHARWLVESGSPPDVASATIDSILRIMSTRTDGWRLLFNNLYASPTPAFSTTASPLVAAAVRGRTPGRALDVACGQGRNAVFLAQAGWTVTAIDVSDVGLAMAAEAARLAVVPLDTVLITADAFDYGAAAWDVVVLSYTPVPVTEPAFAARLVRSLRPGGLLVIESFASEATAASRTPVDIDPTDLRHAFRELVVERFEDVVDRSEWDADRNRVVRFVASRT